MIRTMLAAAAALALSACATNTDAVNAAVTAAKVGEAVYCNGITEEARQATRDRLTGGVKVLPCPEPEKPLPAAVPPQPG